MTEVTKLTKMLESLGLSKSQADIYILLVRQGNLRISEIVRSLQMPRSSVYESLKGLFEHGLAEEIIENSFKVVKAYPVVSLRASLNEKIKMLEQQSSDISRLEKMLQTLPASITQPPITVRYYKGRAGARQLFWNTLRAAETIYVNSEWGRGRYVGISFYKNFVAESYTRNIKEKVLTNSSSRVLESIHQHAGTSVSRTRLETIRCFDELTLPFIGETFMYDNIYAHINLKNEEISGFEIESTPFVATQRMAFEILWEMATPLQTDMRDKHEH